MQRFLSLVISCNRPFHLPHYLDFFQKQYLFINFIFQPELVEKLIVADISPVTSTSSMVAIPEIFRALESVTLPTDVGMSSARSLVDDQLSEYIPNQSLRSFLLTNLIQKSNGRCLCVIH